jgi:hypothetical protein
VKPRRALWIAAGLGDVAGVRSFIKGKGTLTPEGRLNRPDTMAMGWFVGRPPNHEADDLEIMWEAFQIAGWNHRWAAMDALLDAGLPVDHAPMVWPLIMDASANLLVPLAEYLVSRGADVEREWDSNGSAQSHARDHIRSQPQNGNARRLLAICRAGTVDEILADLDAKRQSPPPADERVLRAMQLAADDAARQGQSAVSIENLLIGLLRVADGAFASLIGGTGADMSKLKALVGPRLLPDKDPLIGQDLPADESAAAALRAATAEADRRRRDSVRLLHLFAGIFAQGGGVLLADVGANKARAEEMLDDIL